MKYKKIIHCSVVFFLSFHSVHSMDLEDSLQRLKRSLTDLRDQLPVAKPKVLTKRFIAIEIGNKYLYGLFEKDVWRELRAQLIIKDIRDQIKASIKMGDSNNPEGAEIVIVAGQPFKESFWEKNLFDILKKVPRDALIVDLHYEKRSPEEINRFVDYINNELGTNFSMVHYTHGESEAGEYFINTRDRAFREANNKAVEALKKIVGK